jgi:hypothetical protein
LPTRGRRIASAVTAAEAVEWDIDGFAVVLVADG